MADFALGQNGKLDITGGTLKILDGDLATRQRLTIALRLLAGEWFRDQRAGTDYRGAILGKNTDLARRAELRRRIMSVPRIRSIDYMRFTLDSKTRKLVAAIGVISDSGALLTAEVSQP